MCVRRSLCIVGVCVGRSRTDKAVESSRNGIRKVSGWGRSSVEQFTFFSDTDLLLLLLPGCYQTPESFIFTAGAEGDIFIFWLLYLLFSTWQQITSFNVASASSYNTILCNKIHTISNPNQNTKKYTLEVSVVWIRSVGAPLEDGLTFGFKCVGKSSSRRKFWRFDYFPVRRCVVCGLCL